LSGCFSVCLAISLSVWLFLCLSGCLSVFVSVQKLKNYQRCRVLVFVGLRLQLQG